MREPIKSRSTDELHQIPVNLQAEAQKTGVNLSGTHTQGSVFELVTDFAPAGDQPQAIEKLVRGVEQGMHHGQRDCANATSDHYYGAQ